jgi:glycosyltransferase involved in cell wall biosynthesis
MCGMALYDIAQDNFTHYADPGKVKAYTELGLPVVMTRISDVVPHIERFKAGEIVDAPGTEALAQAVARVAENQRAYRDGVSRFNAFFDYRAYYETSFSAWEKLWP